MTGKVLCIAGILGIAWFAGSARADSHTEGVSTETETTTPQTMPSEPEAMAAVARAAFTTEIVDREPQDSIERVTTEHSKIFYFTEFQEFQGHTLTHVWEREGEEMARVSFAVGGPRWRVFSRKNLEPSWTGTWRVRVLDEEGNVLRSDDFMFVSAAEAPPEASSEDVPASPAPPGVD